MLSKCANPACSARFRYLHEGRIFNLASREGMASGNFSIEHYWLCNVCVVTLKVTLEDGSMRVAPRHPELPPLPEKVKEERVTARRANPAA